jgi:hypothetical protein
MCDESVSLLSQFRPAFDVIKEFAIKDNKDIPSFIANRLLAVRETDNAETPRSESDSRPYKKALFVRPAMQERAGHSLNAALWHRTSPDKINDARNAAHDLIVLVRNL